MVIMQDRPGKGHFYSDNGGKSWYESVTGVLRNYPKGEKFYEWVAKHGYNADRIKQAAGSVGTRVHKALEELTTARTSPSELHAKYALGPEEYMALLGFSRWCDARKPQIHHQELAVISHRLRVGGTVDLIAEIDDGIVVVDFKTSRHVSSTFWLQLHAYAYAIAEMKLYTPKRLMVLHLNPVHEEGYREIRRPYQHEILQQFYALRFLHEHVAKNERTRTEEKTWDDDAFPIIHNRNYGIDEISIP